MFAGSLAIGKTSQVKDAAWEFLKYTASDFFQQYVWNHCSSEGLPCVKSALNFQGVAGDEQYQLVLNSMSYLWTPRYPYRSVTPRGSLQSAIQSALNGSMDVEAALDQAQPKPRPGAASNRAPFRGGRVLGVRPVTQLKASSSPRRKGPASRRKARLSIGRRASGAKSRAVWPVDP